MCGRSLAWRVFRRGLARAVAVAGIFACERNGVSGGGDEQGCVCVVFVSLAAGCWSGGRVYVIEVRSVHQQNDRSVPLAVCDTLHMLWRCPALAR